MQGNIHSIETFGTVDGPGIRFVVFMQGCPMRCLYCHNPDTWNYNAGIKMTTEEILNKYESLKEFYRNGGITLTGGEPLLQIDFITELFQMCNEKNIHTCLDTSGILFDRKKIDMFDKLIKYTNLVMLDIKHINDEEHKKLTGHTNKNILEFARYLSDLDIPVWIRHVVVPGITYNEKYLKELGRFLSELKNVKALDVLPYHDRGKIKYKELNIDYPLKETPALSSEDAKKARNIILNKMLK